MTIVTLACLSLVALFAAMLVIIGCYRDALIAAALGVLLLLCMAGCATTTTMREGKAQHCILVTPPPFLGDPEDATDAELRALVRWSVDAWGQCADIGWQAGDPWSLDAEAQ